MLWKILLLSICTSCYWESYKNCWALIFSVNFINRTNFQQDSLIPYLPGFWKSPLTVHMSLLVNLYRAIYSEHTKQPNFACFFCIPGLLFCMGFSISMGMSIFWCYILLFGASPDNNCLNNICSLLMLHWKNLSKTALTYTDRNSRLTTCTACLISSKMLVFLEIYTVCPKNNRTLYLNHTTCSAIYWKFKALKRYIHPLSNAPKFM